jgi:hypothetical protein
MAALHAVVTMACITYAFGASMQRFDNPELSIGPSERIVSLAASALTLPGRLLWGPWTVSVMPDAFEWIVFLANSALWGWCLVTLASWIEISGTRRRAQRDART